ncbi:MAG TPA: ABC transporter permease [Gryllotalpicola sp.]
MTSAEREAPRRRSVPLIVVDGVRRIVPMGLWQSALAVIAGLIICFFIILAVGGTPLVAFKAFTLGTFQNAYSFGSMIAIATVLAVTGFSSTVAFRAGAFNIGSEGQLVMAGLVTAVVAQHLPGPGGVVQIVALLAAAATGMLWIAVPTYLRVRFRINEILTTLMMNYIAADLSLFLVNSYFRDKTSGAVETPPLAPSRWLAGFLAPSAANIGAFVALAIGLVLWFVFTKTRVGMRMEVAGLQPAFADYLGIRSVRYLWNSMLGSGGLAGLAGGLAILGISHEYIDGFSPQYGFLGITVALIGRLRPLGVLVAAALYACLITGATAMQAVSNVPYSLVFILQGILILLITSQGLFRGRAA